MGTDPLPRTVDFLVIGGGIVGLTLALEMRQRHPKASITVLEKEASCGWHASGRNSGVLHAGFYYTADSLKAKFTRDGNRRLNEWCAERGVLVNRCGKLVVAKDEKDWEGLDILLQRAQLNGVQLEEISAEQAQQLEPRVKTCGRALLSPTTSSVDPTAVMQSMVEQAYSADIQIRTRTRWLGRHGTLTRTSAGDIDPGYLINAGGLHAVHIARAYGFADRYCMLPFKGLYLYGHSNAGKLSHHIYPVPDLEMPFLGVHFTVTVDGHVKIGPTALPALWLENYGGPFGSEKLLSRFSASQLGQILWRELSLAVTDSGFRKLAWREAPKMLRSHLVKQGARLASGIRVEDFDRWGRAGIRAQLFELNTRKLVMDFCYQGDERSLHVLNAVSPAFTCSLPFAEHLADEIEKRL